MNSLAPSSVRGSVDARYGSLAQSMEARRMEALAGDYGAGEGGEIELRKLSFLMGCPMATVAAAKPAASFALHRRNCNQGQEWKRRRGL